MSYFVTASDGDRVYFLAGPYTSKDDAKAKVDTVRDIACDPQQNRSHARAWFMAYGVTRWKSTDQDPPKARLGVL